jgi:hypothetical protein
MCWAKIAESRRLSGWMMTITDDGRLLQSLRHFIVATNISAPKAIALGTFIIVPWYPSFMRNLQIPSMIASFVTSPTNSDGTPHTWTRFMESFLPLMPSCEPTNNCKIRCQSPGVTYPDVLPDSCFGLTQPSCRPLVMRSFGRSMFTSATNQSITDVSQLITFAHMWHIF